MGGYRTPRDTARQTVHPPTINTLGKMNKRTAVTAADLFVLLDREFRRRKPRECAACFIQLPFRVDTRDSKAANWEALVPPECGHGCDLVVEELVFEFQSLYELRDPGEAQSR